MISPVRTLAAAAAALVTGSIAQAGHVPSVLPPATPVHQASPMPATGGSAYCPPSVPAGAYDSHDVVVGSSIGRGSAVQMNAAPVAPQSTVITGSTAQVYGRNTNARANVGGSGAYVYLGHSVGDGVGYRDGYSLFGAFVPLLDTAHGDGIWFSQGHYLLLQDDNFEGDSAFGIGLGRRQVVGNGVLSLAGFYDWDSRFGDYDQLGFNIGYTGCRFSFNANYYNVLDDDADQLSRHVSHTKFVANDGTGNGQFRPGSNNPRYNGHQPYAPAHPGYGVAQGGAHPGQGGFDNLAQDITTSTVRGLDGFDVNFGYLVLPSKCDCCRGLRATAGFYGYSGHGIDNFYGARGGLLYDANPNFLLGAQLQDDDRFGTTINATAVWTPCRRTPCRTQKVCCGTDSCGRPIYSRRTRVRSPFLYDLVQRQNRIALAQDTDVQRVFLSDPKTGERYRVVHVGNTAGFGKDTNAAEGTSQNAYATIADVEAFSQAGDILFVQGGSEFDENLTLKADQKLIGEGSNYVFSSTEHGDFTLGTVTGDTSRSVIGETANLGVSGNAISVGEGHVVIDRVITRGDILANNITDGQLVIRDTIVDCGNIEITNYAGGAMFDGSVTLDGVRVFTEAGSTATALILDNISGDVIAKQLDQDGLFAQNDSWFTLNLAAPNDNWDGRNGFFATDGSAASITNIGGNVVLTQSVFNSTSLPVDSGVGGAGLAGPANVTIGPVGGGLHLANNAFSGQLVSINAGTDTFLENLSYGVADVFAQGGSGAFVHDPLVNALFSVGNTGVSDNTLEVLGNPFDGRLLPTTGTSINPHYTP